LNFRSWLGPIRLARFISLNSTARETVVLTTGYYPLQMFAILISARLIRVPGYSYIFDTHKQATQKMSWVKRSFVNAYFSIGFRLARRLHGWLVLNDQFIRKGRITTRYLKTKVGVTGKHELVSKSEQKLARPKVFVFAGTLNDENGVALLVDFLAASPTAELKIHVYGDGESVDVVRGLVATDCRVEYFGRVPDGQLREALTRADFLLCLRDPAGLSADFSFPSKLINFMSTGTPVISNWFPGLDRSYAQHLHMLAKYDVPSLAFTLTALINGKVDRALGEEAKTFIESTHQWEQLSAEVLDFVSARFAA
jgi:glycosyltransferase involved in cell wall biosynthesis